MDISALILFTLLPWFLTAQGLQEECEAGLTGVNCDIRCPTQCTACEKVNQHCTGHCRHKHHFGKQCEQICPKFCDGACNISTGSCFRCSPTYGGDFCNISCPANCRSTCDMNTRECHHCKLGFTGAFCNDTCSGEQSNITKSYMSCFESCPSEVSDGVDCNTPCPENCKDGCYKDTWECLNCAEGFGGRICNESCPENCLNGCDRYKGICHGCELNYYGKKCLKACPTNCKDKCNQDTGHCLECESGFQGHKCNETCLPKCSSCNKTTGVCKSCEAGFKGTFCNQTCNKNCEKRCEQTTGECTKCQRGFTGLFCDERCSRYCRDECEQHTGECTGCIDGYTGRFCNKTCPMKCLGNCDQYTEECDLDAELLLLKVSGILFASAFIVILVVILAKRFRNRLRQDDGQNYLAAIPETEYRRSSSYSSHRYWYIEEHKVGDEIKGPVASARINNRSAQKDVHLRLPPPLPRQKGPTRNPPPQQDLDPEFSLPLPCTPYKPSGKCIVNDYLKSDVIFENAIYESANEAHIIPMELVLHSTKGETEQFLLKKIPENPTFDNQLVVVSNADASASVDAVSFFDKDVDAADFDVAAADQEIVAAYNDFVDAFNDLFNVEKGAVASNK